MARLRAGGHRGDRGRGSGAGHGTQRRLPASGDHRPAAGDSEVGHEPGWPHSPAQWRRASGSAASPARDWVHRLRAGCDAVIVGGGTVRADDPLLTSRGRRRPEPLRVVMSRSLDLPESARLWDQAMAPTLVAHSREAPRGGPPAAGSAGGGTAGAAPLRAAAPAGGAGGSGLQPGAVGVRSGAGGRGTAARAACSGWRP